MDGRIDGKVDIVEVVKEFIGFSSSEFFRILKLRVLYIVFKSCVGFCGEH